MSSGILDLPGLVAALEKTRTARSATWRQVAREAWPPALNPHPNGAHRQRPDVDAFASLVLWLGGGADQFLKRTR